MPDLLRVGVFIPEPLGGPKQPGSKAVSGDESFFNSEHVLQIVLIRALCEITRSPAPDVFSLFRNVQLKKRNRFLVSKTLSCP